MKRLIPILCVLALAACAAGRATAQPAARSDAAPARARTSGHHAPRRARPARPAPAAPGLPRTLSDVHIEGEIPVPQVLFVTARDQRRFLEFQHHRYLPTSTQLGEATPFPTWVAVTHGSSNDTRKETPR